MTCGLGLCAAIGGKLLKDMGFKDVVLLEGGVQKWQEDGYKLDKWFELYYRTISPTLVGFFVWAVIIRFQIEGDYFYQEIEIIFQRL